MLLYLWFFFWNIFVVVLVAVINNVVLMSWCVRVYDDCVLTMTNMTKIRRDSPEDFSSQQMFRCMCVPNIIWMCGCTKNWKWNFPMKYLISPVIEDFPVWMYLCVFLFFFFVFCILFSPVFSLIIFHRCICVCPGTRMCLTHVYMDVYTIYPLLLIHHIRRLLVCMFPSLFSPLIFWWTTCASSLVCCL